MDNQENVNFDHEENDSKQRRRMLKKRHFRLKLYEYCFKILYGDYPLRQITDNNFHRSQSLDDQLNEESPTRQRNVSSLSLEQKNNRFMNELNTQLAKAEIMDQLKKERRQKRKERKQVFEDFDVLPKVSTSPPKQKDDPLKEDMQLKQKEGSKKSQAEAEKPKFQFLRKSNFKRLDETKIKHYYTPKKYQNIHRSTTNIQQTTAAKPQPDYSKRFSSIPVVSRRATSLPPKKRNVVEREIEADRQALKEFVIPKQQLSGIKSPKQLNVTKPDSKTPADTARSWISDKQKTEDEVDENQINFERSWSAWSLKKAEMLEWDPDFDYQPIGPQEKKIRQKYYKNSLMKESGEIEQKRKVALENTMVFAQVRKDQVMKTGTIPKPTVSKPQITRPTNKTTLKLPVNKMPVKRVPISRVPVKRVPVKKQDVQKEESELKKLEEKDEGNKTSFLGQIKKALQNVPEKLKEMLSFGDTLNANGPKRSSSTNEVTSDSKRHALLSRKPSIRRHSLTGDFKKSSKRHLMARKPIGGINLHKHNLKVDSTLGNVLLSKPKQQIEMKVIEESTKMPEKIAKLGNQQRKPISWRSTQELDKLQSTKQQISQNRQASSGQVKLPQIKTIKNAGNKSNQQTTTSTVHLVPISKPKETVDPASNPYRSAGRKYSPIPAAGFPSRAFNPEVGRCKIIDFIERNWEYKKTQLTYRVEHFHAVQIENNKQRFKYRVFWTSTKTEQEGIIYFNVDVSRIDSFDPIEMTYRFQGQHHNHRTKFSPTATPYRKRWIKSLENGHILEN